LEKSVVLFVQIKCPTVVGSFCSKCFPVEYDRFGLVRRYFIPGVYS